MGVHQNRRAVSPGTRLAVAVLGLGWVLGSVVAFGAVSLADYSAGYAIHYGDCGTWWNGSNGLEVYGIPDSGADGFFDLAGTTGAWTPLVARFDVGAGEEHFIHNDGAGECDGLATSEYADSLLSEHSWQLGDLELRRHEEVLDLWTSGGEANLLVHSSFELHNPSSVDAVGVAVMVAVNPMGSGVDTINDVEDASALITGDDWAGAEDEEGVTIGFSPCHTSPAAVGFAGEQYDPGVSLSDPEVAASDATLHLVFETPVVPAGGSATFSYVMGLGHSYLELQAGALAAAETDASLGSYCGCDADGDGHASAACFGTDCDDTDPTLTLDCGPVDTGPWDTGPWDTGPWDTGPWDTGPWDTGPWETGQVDSAAPDSAVPDSGETAVTPGSWGGGWGCGSSGNGALVLGLLGFGLRRRRRRNGTL